MPIASFTIAGVDKQDFISWPIHNDRQPIPRFGNIANELAADVRVTWSNVAAISRFERLGLAQPGQNPLPATVIRFVGTGSTELQPSTFRHAKHVNAIAITEQSSSFPL